MNTNLIQPKYHRDCLLFAFRYALGRCSTAPSTVTDSIIASWDHLSEHDKNLIRREIRQAIAQGMAGMDCDVKTWESILKL